MSKYLGATAAPRPRARAHRPGPAPAPISRPLRASLDGADEVPLEC